MKISVAIVLFAAALVAACRQEEGAAPSQPLRPVLSTVLNAGGASGQSFSGTVEPRTRASLAFQVLGQLVARHVKAGDLVRAGEPLAAIDATALELSVRSAEAALRNAAAERDNAESSAARIDALRKTGTAAESSWDAASAARDAAAAKLRQAEADLAKARDVLGYAQLTADFDGVVTATGAEVGQTVAAGQMVVTLARLGARDAVIDVPEWMAGETVPGTAFSVSLQIAPEVSVAGTVRELAPEADALTRTRRLKIALDDPPELFRLGSTVTAVLDRRAAPALAAPEGAVFTEGDKRYVWLVEPDADLPTGKVTARAVTVGVAGDGMVAISAGLAPGDRIVTAGVHSLTEGQRVALEGGLL